MNTRTAAVAAAFGVALLVAGCSGTGGAPEAPVQAATGVATEDAAEPSPEPSETPAPTPEADPDLFYLGESVTYAGITLTVNKVEVLPSIPTNDGSSLDAAAGEQLVLVSTHFVNSGADLVDLSCAGPYGAYIQGWDDQEREMANLFETHRIPGNPECNAQLLSGQEHDWNFAYRAIAGSTPLALTIADMNAMDGNITIDLRGPRS